ELLGAVATEVLQKHVAFRRQLVEEAEPFRLRQVEGDAPLVAVAGEVVRAERAEERRPPGAGVVAGAGALDLDDVRPEVAEQLPAEGAGQRPRGVEDAHTSQGTVGVSLHEGRLDEASRWRGYPTGVL